MRQLMRSNHLPEYLQPLHSPSRTSILSTKPLARNQLTPGTVVWAYVDFHESQVGKGRPCMVISATEQTATVMAITTKRNSRRGPIRAQVPPWSNALTRPSWFVGETATIDRRHIYEYLGYVETDLLSA